MNAVFQPAPAPLADFDLLKVQLSGPVIHIELNRPDKRNAISDPLVKQLHAVFSDLPSDVRAAVLSGVGDHFSAGLDLSELADRDVLEGIAHSRMWHAAMDQVQMAKVPVVTVLRGAVVGGGLELAAAAHIRVAEPSAFYALPEGQRGVFVGGGGSTRLPRLIGVARMMDMMLTGRVLSATEGQEMGISQYLVEDGQGLGMALELAHRIAQNAPMSNFAVIQALPRIADLSRSEGLFVESLMASIAQADEGAKERMRAFLEGRAHKVRKP